MSTTHYTKAGAWYTCAYCQQRSQGERPADAHLRLRHGERLIDERIVQAQDSLKHCEGELARYLNANALVADLAAGRIVMAPELREDAKAAFETFASKQDPYIYKDSGLTPEAHLRANVAEAQATLATFEADRMAYQAGPRVDLEAQAAPIRVTIAALQAQLAEAQGKLTALYGREA